ncbi:MAG: EAL domain-containing protein [Actinobacteria bacterium]|nr:EAL domain-containing protein [Actinomycetota bacterium]
MHPPPTTAAGRRWADTSSPERWLAVVLVAAVATSATARLATWTGPHPLPLLWAVCDVAFAAAAVACLRRADRTDAGRAWALQGAGLASYLAAELYAQAHHHELPFPSPADALWLGLYPATYASIVLHARSRVEVAPSRSWLDGLTAGLAAAALVAGLALRPLLAIGTDRVAVVATSLAYPLADLALLVLLVVTFRVAPPRSISPALQFAGLTSFLLADTLFLVGQVDGTWRPGSAIELLWLLGVLLIGSSAITWVPPVRQAALEPTLAVPLAATIMVTALLLVGQRSDLPGAAVGLAVAAVGLAVVRLASVAGEIRRSAQAQRRQRIDPLTGLASRSAFARRLDAHLLDPASPRALVLVVDVDDVDDIDRSLGTDAGLRVRRAAADRLAALLEPGWFAARVGSATFAVAVPSPAALEGGGLAIDVRLAMLQPINVAGIPLALNTTVGIAAAPEHGTSAAQLLGAADLAVRQGQRSSTRITVYRPAASEASAPRLALLSELRTALDRGEIVAHLQPQVHLRTGRPVGVEALARWVHPTRGTIPPATFMPLAVESGLLPELTRTMVGQATTALRRCAQAGHPVDVSLNVSALDLADERVVACIEAAVAAARAEPARLVLELTEDAVMVDRHRAIEILARMRTLGAGTSVDDYGTGNASLAYLRDLPLDEVKVDRSFVRGGPADRRSAALTRSTIALAHELGLTVVAEGIEEPEIHDWLVALGCDVGQGFLYARPMPLEDLVRWLHERARRTA